MDAKTNNPCGAPRRSKKAAAGRLALMLAVVGMLASVSPDTAEAGWFKRITNPKGAKRFLKRATNTRGIEHFAKTNIAGLERWLDRVCAHGCNTQPTRTVPIARF